MKLKSRIMFDINWAKSLEGLHYLVTLQPGITSFFVAKLFYYADKQHILDWGRPISGDTYFAMENGPVPTAIYNLIKKDEFISDDLVADFEYRIRKDGRSLYPSKAFENIYLSRTDMEYLQDAQKTYGHMSFPELWKLVHEEKAWREAWENRTAKSELMDLGLIIEDKVSDKNALLSELKEKTTYQASSNYGATS